MTKQAHMRDLLLVLFAVCPLVTSWAVDTPGKITLDIGYIQLYNFDLVHAHATFHQWEQLHPQDPLGPASDAAVYLFGELNRLHILESDFFTDDAKIKTGERPPLDPIVKREFESQLAKSQQLADEIMAHAPSDPHATFAKILISDLRGHYVGLIEKRRLASLSYLKTGRMLAERLLAQDPVYYDAYLALGIENYLLGINSAPIRWLLRMSGAQTDKKQGVAYIRTTAENGHYMAPYARTLLAVVALRAKDFNAAKQILQALATEYPQNKLYAYELHRLQ